MFLFGCDRWSIDLCSFVLEFDYAVCPVSPLVSSRFLVNELFARSSSRVLNYSEIWFPPRALDFIFKADRLWSFGAAFLAEGAELASSDSMP